MIDGLSFFMPVEKLKKRMNRVVVNALNAHVCRYSLRRVKIDELRTCNGYSSGTAIVSSVLTTMSA